MTYEEHKSAVEQATLALNKAIRDARADNFDVQPHIFRTSFMGGECIYLTGLMRETTFVDPARASGSAVILHRMQTHEAVVLEAAGVLADAFTAAAKDHYAFRACVIGGEDERRFANIEDIASEFLDF